ncbi:MAG: hypothetical protein AAF721_30995 [Myxococcota bacterium]
MTRRGALTLLCLTGCPSESPERCTGAGDITIRARPNRLDTDDRRDGAELPVFLPPQDGTFTELDVEIGGIAAADVETVRVEVEDEDGELLAIQEYNGAGIPWMCQPDGSIIVLDLPVRFSDALVLAELDGVEATLLVGVDGPDGSTDVRWAVVLRQTP